MPSVRELIRARQRELLETADLPPVRATEMLNQLTALLGNVNTEVREADLKFKQELLRQRQKCETSAEAKTWAEASAEYARLREAEDIKDETIEAIRSLKVFIRNAAEEMRSLSR